MKSNKSINAIFASSFVILFAVFFIPNQVNADFTVPPFGYVTIVNENIGGENNFEFDLQRKNSSGTFEFTGNSMSTDPNSDNYIGYGSEFYLPVSNPGEEYRIIEYPPADNWISVSVECASDNPNTTFIPYPNGIEIHPAYDQNSFIACTFTNVNGVANTKTPILFVPGLLGTEIKKGNDLIWFNNDIINPFNSDNFLDSLIFKNTLVPNENNLSLSDVIGKKDFPVFDFDYTEGLANEFKNQGYVIGEGAAGQNFFTFPYDWRYGVSGTYPIPANTSQIPQTNSGLLKEKINQILAQTGADKVDMIAHSMGGLIVKKYVMDNADPKIGKLVFVGVPNLGSIDAAKTLLMGNNFKVTGLNDKEIYKISQNMPAAYDLLPSQAYFSRKGSYVNDLNHFPFGSKLDYAQVNSLFKQTGLNRQGLDNAIGIHTPEFDGYDVRSKNIDAYNIVGCKSPTIAGVNYLITDEGSEGYSIWRDPISGDDTVPRESAESIPADSEKTFYAAAPEHGKMPSAPGIRQKIVNIIAGKNLDEGRAIYAKSQVDQNSLLCKLRVMVLIALSPVDIKVTDQSGNILGTDDDSSVRYEIPGAGFEIIDGHKYVYLPMDNNQTYDIDLKGSGAGTFTLIKKEIGNDQTAPAVVFNDIPVTPEFSARLDVLGTVPKIITGGQEILPTAEVDSESLDDIVPPQTAIAINGNAANNFYNTDISINLSAQDFSQEEIIPAGIFSINYSLDGADFAEYESPIMVLSEGTHQLTYFAADKLGNKEKEKTISFTIDKTAPEIKFVFDQTKNDLVFTAADNISNPENIVISDQNGAVSATDEAGNVAKLSFAEKNRRQSLRAQLSELSYNGKVVDIKGNQLAFAWFYGYTPKIPLTPTGLQPLPTIPATLPKNGPLSFLLQQAKIKDGSFIVALYANNKTLILEYKNKKLNLKTITGVKIINFATNKGIFFWSY